MKKFILFIVLLLFPSLVFAATGQIRSVVMMAKAQSSGPALLDDFNSYPNGAIVSANWDTAGSWGSLTIASQQVTGGESEDRMMYWTGTTFNANQQAQLKITTVANAIDPCVRVQPDTNSGYCLKLQSSTELRIVRFVYGTEDNLQTISSETISAGDTIGISVNGVNPGVLTAYHNGVALSPTASDSDWDSGQPGIYTWSNTVRGDDFSGGNL